MAATRNVAVLVGSLRKDSLNRKMANALSRLAPSELSLRIVEIGGLPLYNQDDDANPPPAATEFKEAIAKSDAVLFVTPEYNRSVPGVLKNAIDVGSRPYGKSAWTGKPGAVISVSPGAIGGFGANHHLRQSFVFLNVPMMPSPEAYIGNAANLFAADGTIANDSTPRVHDEVHGGFRAMDRTQHRVVTGRWTARLSRRPRARCRETPHVRDHFAPGRRQDDADREAPALRRRDPDGRHRQGAQEPAPCDVGLDGSREAARHLGDELRDAVRLRRATRSTCSTRRDTRTSRKTPIGC